jgi:lycopene cyclase CruA
VGWAHREWNAGEAEIAALSRCGLLSASEVDELVVARYAYGICRWHGGGTYPVRGVLDRAIDAGALLMKARERAKASGVAILDGHALEAHSEGRGGALLSVSAAGGERAHGAPIAMSTKVLVDARGASSPYATADLACPTVGGVLTGLAEGDEEDAVRPDVGEILVTTEGVEGGRQHLWEAFPGRTRETTVYLFYYARSEDVPQGSLMDLYARFFRLLSRYKRGEARLLRPTFGYIPGWSRLCDAPAPEGQRLVLVGDAAARHSPLTFCGFGATVRALSTTATSIARVAEGRSSKGEAKAACDAPIHAGTGALAMLMATPSAAPDRAGAMNALLDTAFSVLYSMGNDAHAALLRDEMSAAEFVRFLRETAARRPEVYREVLGALKVGALGRWGLALLRELYRAR